MAYDMSLKKKWDEYSIKQTAFNEGKLEGKLEGAHKKARDIAQNLLKKGYSNDAISELTGLSRDEVAKLVENRSE